MNNIWGLKLVLTPDQHSIVLLLAQSLDPRKPSTVSEALKLLASLYLVPDRNDYEKAKQMKRSEEYEKKIVCVCVCECELLEIPKHEFEAKAADLKEKINLMAANGVVAHSPNKLPKVNIPMPTGPGGFPTPLVPAMGGHRPPPPPLILRLSPAPDMGGPPPPAMPIRMGGPCPLPMFTPIVPDLREKSFWFKCQEDKLVSEELLAELSSKFFSKPVKKEPKDSVDKAATLSKKKLRLKVLETKATQNGFHSLIRIAKHLSYEQVKICLLSYNTDTLYYHTRQQLIQYLQSAEQLKHLQDIEAKGEPLPAIEQFAVTIGKIKRLLPRLYSLHFKSIFDDQMKDVKLNVVARTAACNEVCNRKKFSKILKFILLMEFGIFYLTKLIDTKDVENKQTLLHYLIDVVEKKFPETLNLD
uniref:FH2 domain-containing protein n=1 Tax=Glossina brevipalpis TaxID=37001 RepID=A0A1A9WVD9_9MUSC